MKMKMSSRCLTAGRPKYCQYEAALRAGVVAATWQQRSCVTPSVDIFTHLNYVISFERGNEKFPLFESPDCSVGGRHKMTDR